MPMQTRMQSVDINKTGDTQEKGSCLGDTQEKGSCLEMKDWYLDKVEEERSF